jgi:excisionase family DNA binding protein
MAVPSPGRALLSVPEAAGYLGISEGTLRNWLSMRQLDYVKVGRLTKISRATLDRYIDTHTMRAVSE